MTLLFIAGLLAGASIVCIAVGAWLLPAWKVKEKTPPVL